MSDPNEDVREVAKAAILRMADAHLERGPSMVHVVQPPADNWFTRYIDATIPSECPPVGEAAPNSIKPYKSPAWHDVERHQTMRELLELTMSDVAMDSNNVEIKFIVPDLEIVCAAVRLASLTTEWRGSDDGHVMRQRDTHFECNEPGVRKKVRQFFSLLSDEDMIRGPELITHSRSGTDTNVFKRETVDLEDERATHSKLGTVICVVEKMHRLMFLGRTRVHLDTITGLDNHFVKLEVVLQPGESEEAGRAEAERIAGQLGLTETARRTSSYLDLVLTKHALLPHPAHQPWLHDTNDHDDEDSDGGDDLFSCADCGHMFDGWSPLLTTQDYCCKCQKRREKEYCRESGIKWSQY